jgi:ribosomal RNA-processing protein 17
LHTDATDEWSGIAPSPDKDKRRAQEDEYSDEDQLATVTVVEDFDPSALIYDSPSSSRAGSPSSAAQQARPAPRESAKSTQPTTEKALKKAALGKKKTAGTMA